MVYVLGVAPAGLKVPVEASIGKPGGEMEKLPPLLPVMVTGATAAVAELQRLDGE